MQKKVTCLCLTIMLCAAAAAQSTETVLYSFGAYPNDGAFPDGGLLVDQSGNIYGVTNGGGAYCENDGGCGTVYELSPALGGGWTETVLHNFCSTGNSFTCPDGAIPYAGLVEDEAGNLYGTTSLGGTGKYGIVYRLSAPAEPGGSWTQTTLWNFSGGAHNGFEPGLGKAQHRQIREHIRDHDGGWVEGLRCGLRAEPERAGIVLFLAAAQLLRPRRRVPRIWSRS